MQYAKALWKRLAGKLRHKLIVMREQRKRRELKKQEERQQHQQAQIDVINSRTEVSSTTHMLDDEKGGNLTVPTEGLEAAQATVAADASSEGSARPFPLLCFIARTIRAKMNNRPI